MFTQHWLITTQFNWDTVVRPNNGLTLVFCLLLLLITTILIAFRRKMTLLFRALFSQRHFSIIQREGKLLEDRMSPFVLLYDVLTITTGLVMFCTTYINISFTQVVICLTTTLNLSVYHGSSISLIDGVHL